MKLEFDLRYLEDDTPNSTSLFGVYRKGLQVGTLSLDSDPYSKINSKVMILSPNLLSDYNRHELVKEVIALEQAIKDYSKSHAGLDILRTRLIVIKNLLNISEEVKGGFVDAIQL